MTTSRRTERLNEINQDYQITDKLEEEAAKLPARIGGAAGVLRDIGFGIVNGIFAFITILVLAAFMLSGGPDWRRQRTGAACPPTGRSGWTGSSTTWRKRGQRLCHRGADRGGDRRHVHLHRADDPRGARSPRRWRWWPASSRSCRSWGRRSPRC